MRSIFAEELAKQMRHNSNIWVVVGDLGYKMWDDIRDEFPERFINVGAAEQTLVGIAVGLALKRKIPVVYSITTFLLYRPFETIRNYVDHESIPVKLIGSGRDNDYIHDGFSHWSFEDRKLLKILPNIEAHWPKKEDEIPQLVATMIATDKPWYLNLKRTVRRT